MPLTKKALLISNPGETGAENYCKGVYVDVRNYELLLTSAEGGGWDRDEIIHLDRPTARDVRAHISQVSSRDYVFIMFSGHGWYSAPDRDRILELRRGEEIASAELLAGTKRRTVVLDCCQKVHQESLRENRSQMQVFAANEQRWRIANREACKKLFADSVHAAPQGSVRLMSCSIDELSSDDDTRGGRYNGSVIECVAAWKSKQERSFTSPDPVYSVVATHECAAELTRKLSGGQQNPVIEKPRTAPYFPLAVFA